MSLLVVSMYALVACGLLLMFWCGLFWRPFEPRGERKPSLEHSPKTLPREADPKSVFLALEAEPEETVRALMPFLRALETRQDLRSWAQRLGRTLPALERDMRRPLLALLLARPEPEWVELLVSWPEKHLVLDADEMGAVFTALLPREREAMTRTGVARQLEAMLPWLVSKDDTFAQLAHLGDPATLRVLSPYVRGPLASPGAAAAYLEIVARYDLCVAGRLTEVRTPRGALTSVAAPGDMSLAQKNPPEWEG